MALKKNVNVGDEVEGRCTKCKDVTSHTIVALQDGEIKKVECLVCGSTHKFYPPRPPAAKKAKKTKSSGKSTKISQEEKAQQAILTEWRNAVEGVPENQLKPYQLSGVYQEEDFISHAKFGKGQVRQVLGPQKMEVIFEDGIRRLIFNKPE